MTRINKVFIARSLDGYIADKNGGLDWLNAIPNPDHLDLGYEKFIKEADPLPRSLIRSIKRDTPGSTSMAVQRFRIF